MKETTMALYILYTYCICKLYTTYKFVHEETGVTSPTTKILISTDIAAKALQFTHGLIQ